MPSSLPHPGAGPRGAARRRRNRPAVVALLLATACSPLAAADEMRSWTDATGTFAIEATLLEWNGDRVRLQRPDGRVVRIDFSRLSPADQRFLEESVSGASASSNPLRLDSPPTLPIALPPLDLPAAAGSAPAGAEVQPLATTTPTPLTASPSLPLSLTADPAPAALSVPPCTVSLGEVDSWTKCSRPMVIATLPEPLVAVSIARGMRSSGAPGNRILNVNLTTGETSSLWTGEGRVTLLDHHLPSGRTLLLENHDSVGHGGQLAIASLAVETLVSSSGAERSIQILHRGSLTSGVRIRSLPKVHWARMIDDEHVIAHVDQSISCWNLVSAECLYQIADVDPRSEPVLSPGLRYLALPRGGAIWLHASTDGQPLGRIELDKSLIPGAAFSSDGGHLAITSGRTLRVWDLVAATLEDEIVAPRTLGNSHPVWVNEDLLLSSNGLLISRVREQAVWQYDLVGLDVVQLADRVAIFRNRDDAELRVVELPHPEAAKRIQAPAASVDAKAPAEMLGKSQWIDGGWKE